MTNPVHRPGPSPQPDPAGLCDGRATGTGDEPDTTRAEHSGHTHAVSADANRRYLWVALLLLLAFMISEVVVAFISGSLVLLSDAGHMLSDVGAIGASLWALNLAARPAAGAWTFGWKRAEILSASGNGITLHLALGLISRVRPPAHYDVAGHLRGATWSGASVEVPSRGVGSRHDRRGVRAGYAES